MHNKDTYTHVTKTHIRAYIRVYVYAYTRICARIDICVYAKYARMIRVWVVRLYLSCTVCIYLKPNEETNVLGRKATLNFVLERLRLVPSQHGGMTSHLVVFISARAVQSRKAADFSIVFQGINSLNVA